MKQILIQAAAVALLLAGPARAEDGQRAVETGLLPAVVIDGKAETFTIEQRMARWNTPGVSVAVIDDGRIAWARGYGVIEAGKPAPVTPSTRFQAASISKPIAAAAAMSLVQDGQLPLEGDINGVLKTWKLPASDFTAKRPVTLRDLLSHTGGTTVHGFPGYAQGAPAPTLTQVLEGAKPANTPPVVSQAAPGERWRYSGGGYEIAQLMIEDVTGKAFADVVGERVLKPAGMADSGYTPPATGSFALGHGRDGKPIAGGWHTYPEQAAAGLWTTPSDLARFGLALVDATRGKGKLLDAATAKAMTTPVMNGYGLGPGVEGEGRTLRFSHGGSNEGFRAFWVIHPETGDGVAVMANGEQGDRIAMEIVRATAKAYGWGDFQPQAYASVRLPEAVLAAREGTWTTVYDGERIAFDLRRDGEKLVFDTFRGAFTFTAVSDTEMVLPDTGAKAQFEPGPDGVVVLKALGLELRKE